MICRHRSPIDSIVCFLLLTLLVLSVPAFGEPLEWPAATKEMRPWAYWWWMGSAVTPDSLKAQMTALAGAGMGGLHVIPIYGAEGAQDRYVPFLSPAWMDMLASATTTAESLGMGVDMTLGTGWPYGGPQVGDAQAAVKAFTQSWGVKTDDTLDTPLLCLQQMEANLTELRAYPATGASMDLLGLVKEKHLDWTNRGNDCTVVALYQGWTRQEVKRAAPGGEGPVLDHFSRPKLDHYLARFDEAFSGYRGRMPRCFYVDSYEVYGANWTGALFDTFARNRGYDLREHLHHLIGQGDPDTVGRVRSDYNETVGELLLHEFAEPWAAWGRAKGARCRAESHGSPGNLLDLYATADIPETEGFGAEGAELLMTKFASSAAHLTGKNLVSSESCTWLGEHFQTPLATVKPAIDQFFLGGVNHVFYHGIPFSPDDAPWPGWLFYASTDFGVSNTFFRDFPELNGYITRCQSFLQAGRPDAEVLLYWPVQEVWHVEEGEGIPLKCLSVHNAKDWMHKTLAPFHRTARELCEKGIDFDYVSDRMLENTQGRRFLVIPGCARIAPETMARIAALAGKGTVVLAPDGLPKDVPGLRDVETRRAQLAAARDLCAQTAHYKEGGDVVTGLVQSGARRETMTDQELRFVRRRLDDGYVYFVLNGAKDVFDGWLPLSVAAQSVAVFDPVTAAKALTACRQEVKGCAVRLQLAPRNAGILRTFDRAVSGEPRLWLAPGGDSVTLSGEWRVTFLEGGPTLPGPHVSSAGPVLWTDFDTPETRAFSGAAAYETAFILPNTATPVDSWQLELGGLHESAKVYLNGEYAGAVWTQDRTLDVGRWLRPGENTLRVEASNLMANRIAEMDRRGEKWRYFYFVNIDYKPFDASTWPLLPSGLGGPVVLTPMKRMD